MIDVLNSHPLNPVNPVKKPFRKKVTRQFIPGVSLPTATAYCYCIRPRAALVPGRDDHIVSDGWRPGEALSSIKIGCSIAVHGSPDDKSTMDLCVACEPQTRCGQQDCPIQVDVTCKADLCYILEDKGRIAVYVVDRHIIHDNLAPAQKDITSFSACPVGRRKPLANRNTAIG